MLDHIKNLFKDYSWEFYLWSQEVPIDTPIETVKSQLPPYAKVDWQNSESLGKGILYPVTWIKGQRGKTKHFLGFVDGLYSGCIIKGQ
jgi:hypothetical protein